MNYTARLLLTASASISLSGMATAAILDLGNTTYSVDETLSENDYQIVISNMTPTWTINPGITVITSVGSGDDSGRFFIPMNNLNDSGTFTITGGGTLSIVGNDGYANLRLGEHGGTDDGMVVIAGGSTFELTHPDAVIRVSGGGGSITLDGLGSTFSAPGTYNSGTNTFTATNPGGGSGSFAINLANAASISETTSDGFTTLTVVPEPSSAALLGLGGIALILRRRK